MVSRRVRSQGKRAVVWLVAILVVLTSVAVAYGGTPQRADRDRLQAVHDDPDVVVEERRGGFVLRDSGGHPGDGTRVGLVFYPGGRVEPEAYLWALAPLVERTDVRVFVPRMPLSLAVTDPGRADGFIGSEPIVHTWYVGGHSLGGAMACRYAANNPETVAGVVLFASYCPDDVSETDLSVLAVWGSRDGVLSTERVENPTWAPSDARFVELDGVNHAQFGAYGDQPGDRPATVPDRAARRRYTTVLSEWVESETDG